MTQADPKREFAVEVVQRLVEAGHQALWAGGCVRDFLLHRRPGDYDVATSARPEQVREVFGRRRTHAVGESFGVILVRGPGRGNNVEVATFRTEADYADGRRPSTVRFATAEEDAQRRDFTINGMFYDPLASHVIDYVGGEHDLGHGIVRAIGDPRERFGEDRLRLLRAVRFTATLEFELEEETAAAVQEMASAVNVVAVERIADELRKMLVDRHRSRAVRLMRDLGLLAEMLPELDHVFGRPEDPLPESGAHVLDVLRLLEEASFELAAAALLHDAGPDGRNDPEATAEAVEAIGRRLRWSNRETEHVAWLVRQQRALDDARTLPLSRLKPLLAHPFAEDLLNLCRTVRLAEDSDLDPVLFCEEYLGRTPQEVLDPPPLVTGRDLLERGAEPGPRFKEILQAIRDEQLEERLEGREEALERLEELLRSGD